MPPFARFLATLVVVATFTVTPSLWAQEEGESEDPKVLQARAAFVEGAALAEKMLWGEALARFEASRSLKQHAGTSYNIGICERALGHYTRARRMFRHALTRNDATPGELAASTVQTIEGYLTEIEAVLSKMRVRLAPASAAVAVDGRPLQTSRGGKTPVLIAGVRDPGRGERPPAEEFVVVLDPGAHVFVISRKGYADAVVRRTVRAGSSTEISLELERLPAQLEIASNEDNAAVSIDGVDVGVAPLEVSRPAGDYHVEVHKAGYDPFITDVTLRAAMETDIMAQLQPEAIGLHERWWFWASVGAAVATTVVVTYFVTRPDPERPALNGGGLGWTIEVP